MTFNSGDVVTVDFPGVTGIKRRPAVVLSSATYHANRPDVIVGLITTQTTALGVTDYALQDWQAASGFTSCIYLSEFYCDVTTLSQLGLYWAVIRTRLARCSGLCQTSSCRIR